MPRFQSLCYWDLLFLEVLELCHLRHWLALIHTAFDHTLIRAAFLSI